jgi:hypothetical protein
MMSPSRLVFALAAIAALAACATTDDTGTAPPALTASEGRALVGRLLPPGIPERTGWATDLYAAIASLAIAPTAENICAAVAVTEQESGFQVDPPIPGLATMAWKEIDRQRERVGLPKLMLQGALALPSSTGQSYAERIDTVKTEKQLSDIFEDFIGRVPLGERFLADRNPVRTGGPMQVSIAFAEAQMEASPYPYPLSATVRREVFTRRGGLYFGVAHLLDYPANYDRHLYRFADFNAGRYASRNAAFQAAVTQATGIPLALDGDLLRYENGRPAVNPGSTELAVRVMARRLNLDNEDIRRDLARGRDLAFERTALYTRVFALADQSAARPVPRAVLPQIALESPKITRKLTTEWFANRVEIRYQRCLARRVEAAAAAPRPR